MRLTKLQLYAITELITRLELLEKDNSDNFCSLFFVSCTSVINDITNTDSPQKILLEFFDTTNMTTYSCIVYDDGNVEFLLTSGY